MLKKSNGAKFGVQGVAIGGPQLAVGMLDMNWSLPQQSCGAPKKAASEGFFNIPFSAGHNRSSAPPTQ